MANAQASPTIDVRPRFGGRQAVLCAAVGIRCKRLHRVGFCFAKSARCDSGCCGRTASICSRWLVDPCARLVLGLDTCTLGLWRHPEDCVMLSLSTLLQRRSDEQSGEATLIRMRGAQRRIGLARLCTIEHRHCWGVVHGAINEKRRRPAG